MHSPDRVHVARVYDPPDPDGGARVLVDRLWPRGVSKQAAALDEWDRDIAPSTELREWYGHDPDRFEEFATRYRTELADPAQADRITHLRQLRDERGLTLLTASKAVQISQAAVLANLIGSDS
jgi:uncharacterized protein YeaO (DUF488 family)